MINKRCKNCGQIKGIGDFASNPNYVTGVGPECNSCAGVVNEWFTRDDIAVSRSNGMEEEDRAIPYASICARIVMGSGPAKYRSAWSIG